MSISQTRMNLKVENLGLDPDIFAKILELYQDNHYARLTGIKIVAIGQGKFIAEMVVDKNNSNVIGTLHGGATATLIDVCMGMACFTKGVTVVTGNINISYLSPGRASNKIIAVGQVIRSGKTTFFAEASLEDEKGQIIAKGTGTFFRKGNLLSE
ncbi:PaaI family thioesterase [Desulfosporosinus sp. SYSU MS00001]|uniref:PaaI family thioesterase n=1 Tax=Desulfosporosinus sp. SYSU MS00001 TaxID=3416284 RepID=UPI003CEBA107